MKKKKNDIQAKLEESEIRYRRLFESAYDGILILDPKTGQITDVNPFLEKLLGYTKKEFLNKKLWELGAFKNLRAAKDAFKVLQKNGYVRYEDLPLATKKGDYIDVEFVSNSYLAGGKLVIQCNIRDITERKKIEIIKDARRLLEEERLRVESITNTAHELRTPLAIIKGNVEVSLKSKFDAKASKTALQSINNEVTKLSQILSDIGLITSKAWEFKNRVVYEKLSLKEMVVTVVERCKVMASRKKIKIIVKKIPDIKILGDKKYLEKMMENLIENSIIFGVKNGKTEISAIKSDGYIKIYVADNGVGISKEDLPHVFERFYRGDKSHSGSGVGLGLSIVKWVAELHEGEVHIINGKKNGTTFGVYLPIAPTNVK